MELLTSRVKRFAYTNGLTSLDMHPMREKIIVAAGASNGNIYLWNLVCI